MSHPDRGVVAFRSAVVAFASIASISTPTIDTVAHINNTARVPISPNQIMFLTPISDGLRPDPSRLSRVGTNGDVGEQAAHQISVQNQQHGHDQQLVLQIDIGDEAEGQPDR